MLTGRGLATLKLRRGHARIVLPAPRRPHGRRLLLGSDLRSEHGLALLVRRRCWQRERGFRCVAGVGDLRPPKSRRITRSLAGAALQAFSCRLCRSVLPPPRTRLP